MTTQEIKKELADRKLSMAAIARRLRPKVSRVSVWRTVQKIPGSRSIRIESAVAHAIGRERHEVFDENAA